MREGESNWNHAGLLRVVIVEQHGKAYLRTIWGPDIDQNNSPATKVFATNNFFILLFVLNLETVKDDKAWKFLQIKFCSLIKININQTFTKHPRVYKWLQGNCWQILLADQARDSGCACGGKKQALQLHCFSEDSIHQELLHLSLFFPVLCFATRAFL